MGRETKGRGRQTVTLVYTVEQNVKALKLVVNYTNNFKEMASNTLNQKQYF